MTRNRRKRSRRMRFLAAIALAIGGNGSHRIFFVPSGATVEISNVELSGISAQDGGDRRDACLVCGVLDAANSPRGSQRGDRA